MPDVEIVTLGEPDSPDATVARELTRRLGIGHTQLEWTDGVVVRRQLCPHVGSVAGAVNCIDSSVSLSTDGRMTLSGLTGEMLRSNWPNRAGHERERSVVAGFLSMPLGKADILDRDASFGAMTDGIRSLLSPAAQGTDPEDLFDAYYIQQRLRRWLAARPERFADEFFPLYHPPAIELAFRMGGGPEPPGGFTTRLSSAPETSSLNLCTTNPAASTNRRNSPRSQDRIGPTASLDGFERRSPGALRGYVTSRVNFTNQQ